ncbi:MAG TPA: globin [Parvibaculum sp.]
MKSDFITQSLELVAELCGDPTPLVYARLFAEHPELEALFTRDTSGAVRGQMLAQVIDIFFDHVGRGAYTTNFIRAEQVNHENLGVPPQVFGTFFRTVMECFREVAGDQWTPEMDAAWRELVAELEDLTARVGV